MKDSFTMSYECRSIQNIQVDLAQNYWTKAKLQWRQCTQEDKLFK